MKRINKDNSKTQLQKYAYFMMTLFLAVCMTGCSETNDNHSEKQLSQVADGVVLGSVVKGPLKGAHINVYLLDFNVESLKGELVATGKTNDNGSVDNVIIPGRFVDSEILLLESTGGTEWSNQEPVLPTLRTIIKTSDISKSRPIFATPLTTFLIEIARLSANLSNPRTALDNFKKSIKEQQKTVSQYLGLGLMNNLDIFHTPPLPDSKGKVTEKTLIYRTSIEILGALMMELNQQNTNVNVSVDQLFLALAQDVTDGYLDAKIEESAIDVFSGIELEKLQSILTKTSNELLQLDVPGANYTIAEINKQLVYEAQQIAQTNTDPILLPQITPFIFGIDSDEDYYPDAVDKFPKDKNEWADIDGDNIGDNRDACLAIGAGHTDADNDGICDDINAIPRDLYPQDDSRSSLDDNDRPTAVIRDINDIELPDVKYVYTNTNITFNASLSFDTEGDPLSYYWSVLTPNDSMTVVKDADTAFPYISADEEGDYTITLIASDLEDSDPVSAVIRAQDPQGNVAPEAFAGIKQVALQNTLVTLDGSRSSDANNDELTYLWHVYDPFDEPVILDDNTVVKPVLRVPELGVYRVELKVKDSDLLESPVSRSSITVNLASSPPVAVAGNDQNITYEYGGILINLNGEGSYDNDDEILDYKWELVSKPGGGDTSEDSRRIKDADKALASFMLVIDASTQVGQYEFQLTVSDGSAFSRDKVIFDVQKSFPMTSTLYGSALVSLALLAIPARRRKKVKKFVW